jgi:hypothetical protein
VSSENLQKKLLFKTAGEIFYAFTTPVLFARAASFLIPVLF